MDEYGGGSLAVGLLLLSVFTRSAWAEHCVQTGPCSCQFETWTLDLSPMGRKGGGPRFEEKLGKYTYYYNPCWPFKMLGMGDLAVFQKFGSKGYGLGTQTSSSISSDEYIKYNYKNNTDNKSRSAQVYLSCSEITKFSFLTESDTGDEILYNFLLKSPYTCEPRSLSTGSIILIIFIVGVFVYLIIGVLIQRCLLHAQGWEIVPNYSFWKEFPFLVRDGCCYIFQCCKNTQTYEKI